MTVLANQALPTAPCPLPTPSTTRGRDLPSGLGLGLPSLPSQESREIYLVMPMEKPPANTLAALALGFGG